MKTTTIDTSLLPHVYLTWDTTNAKFYMDSKIGKKTTERPAFFGDRGWRSEYRLLTSGSRPRMAYAKYHEDIERLELAEVTIDTKRKEEPKEWRYAGNKYFLGKDKSIMDEHGNIVTSNFELSRHHTSNDFKGFLGMFYRIDIPSNVSEFKKFLGSDTYIVGSGREVDVRSCWHIQEWYKTTQKVRGVGKQQKLTNKLTEMSVGNADDILSEWLKENNSSSKYSHMSYYYNTKAMYYERLIDGWSVLRFFRQTGENEYREYERMYINDDGSNRIVMPSKDGWVPSKQTHAYGGMKFINRTDAMSKCARLKYIIPAIADRDNSNFSNCLVSILRFPVLEQMISLGYNQTALRIASSPTPNADIKRLFGDYYNQKAKSIYKQAGLNKYQFAIHMAQVRDSGRYTGRGSVILKEMRKTFGDGLIHIDDATFNKYYFAFMNMTNGWRNNIYPQLERLGINREKFIKNTIRMGEKHTNVYGMLDDTLSQYVNLNAGTAPEINWIFDSYSDVVRVHDAIDELKRAQDAERRAMWNMKEAERRKKEEEKRAKLDEERREWEYEDNEYVIRLPKDLNEIVTEGTTQRICIGSYTTRHAIGDTNLFFLRKKSELNVPFYAIEMNKYHEIVQIHGYCNKWLGNDPDAIPTVIRWLRKNGFKCKEQILTCTARGYGAINNYVPMPVVE